MSYLVAFMAMTLGFCFFGNQGYAKEMAIHNGSKVAFDYTLIVDGKVVDSSEKRGPLEYVQGDKKLIPGLTRELEGMKTGQEKTVEIKPEDGYGLVKPEAFKEVPLSSLAPGMAPKPGMMIQGKDSTGRSFPVKIAEVKKDTVVMDLNHPLAGKSLTFKVKIVSVK